MEDTRVVRSTDRCGFIHRWSDCFRCRFRHREHPYAIAVVASWYEARGRRDIDPALAATFVRFWMLRKNVDRRVLIHFGILSAAGGLTGALLHSIASNPALTLVFAALLMFAGATSVTRYSRKMRFGHKTAWIAGAVSGILGGLVGNQGGIRSAALLGFGLNRHAFVATATAIGLVVDAARMPVYFVTEGSQILAIPGVIISSTVGVLAGTFLGTKLLRRIPEEVFHRIVGAIILALGVFMMWRGIQGNS